MHEYDTLVAMAEVDLDQNDAWSAHARLEKALTGVRECRFRSMEPMVLSLLARSNRLVGRMGEARAYAEEAIAIARELGDGHWEGVAVKELSLLDAMDHQDGRSAGAQGEEEVDPVRHG